MPTEQTQERCRKPGCGALKGRCSDWDCPEGDFVRQYEGRAPASPGESTTEQTQAPQGESEVETRMEAELRHAAVNLSIGASYCALSEPEKKALQEYATLIRQSADALDALRAERDALMQQLNAESDVQYALRAERDRYRTALEAVRSHHVEINGGAGRPITRSHTIRIVDEALVEGNGYRLRALASPAPTPAQEESDGR